MSYTGVIIVESLGNTEVLDKVKVLATKIEPITPQHQTPWLSQWTLKTVEIQDSDADAIATELSHSFDPVHPNWYADFKNEDYHFIVFANKVFKVDRHHPDLYQAARAHGLSLGIPDYQVDFAPDDQVWER